MLNSLIIDQGMPTESGMGHSLYQSARMLLAQTNSSHRGMKVFDFLIVEFIGTQDPGLMQETTLFMAVSMDTIVVYGNCKTYYQTQRPSFC